MSLLLTALLLLQGQSIDQLVEKLGSDKIEERNEAARELKKRGEAVIPALERAIQDKDGEVVRSAKEIIRDIRDPLRTESAEETFNRMIESLSSAKTIKVNFKFDFTRGDKLPDFEAKPALRLLIKGADKVSGELVSPQGKEKDRTSDEVPRGSKAYPPKVFRDDVMTGLTRTGVSLALYYGGSMRMNPDRVVEDRVEDRMRLSAVELKGQDALGRILKYGVTLRDEEVMDVTLWCDLKTRLPRKRITSTRGTGENLQHFCEWYEEWVLNAEIPDEKFQLPVRDESLEAKISKVKGNLARFQMALGAYEVDNGGFPTTKQGLAALFNPPDGAKGWKGPYVDAKGALLDPWGNSYGYRCPGDVFPNGYDLFSAGPDGKAGTDDDIPVLKPKNDKEGADLVRKAVESTKAQKSFEATFKARYVPLQGDALDYNGRQVWVAPGILYLGMTGSAGLDRKVIRAGDDVWVHHAINGWLTAAENGDDGAARGIQNPIELLDLLGPQAGAATRTKPGGATITLSGDDLKVALKNHVQVNVINWAKSTAKVDLSVDGDGRLKTLSCDAVLLPNGQNRAQRYAMEVTIVGFNTATELKFADEKGGPIAPGPKIKERIAGLLEGRK